MTNDGRTLLVMHDLAFAIERSALGRGFVCTLVDAPASKRVIRFTGSSSSITCKLTACVELLGPNAGVSWCCIEGYTRWTYCCQHLLYSVEKSYGRVK